ncbi:retinol dehydrogenase 8b [Silurus meridionalis]|nr:retinol dehydrogenase 8b [Silurus meridionalis]
MWYMEVQCGAWGTVWYMKENSTISVHRLLRGYSVFPHVCYAGVLFLLGDMDVLRRSPTAAHHRHAVIDVSLSLCMTRSSSPEFHTYLQKLRTDEKIRHHGCSWTEGGVDHRLFFRNQVWVWPVRWSVFDTNVCGVIRMIKAVISDIKEQRVGHIIIIISTMGLQGVVFNDVYAVSKFSVEGVSLIEPGPVHTDFEQKMLEQDIKNLYSSLDAETLHYFKNNCLSGSMNIFQSLGQTPQQIAMVTVSLLIISIHVLHFIPWSPEPLSPVCWSPEPLSPVC